MRYILHHKTGIFIFSNNPRVLPQCGRQMLENTNLVEKYLNPVTSWGQRSKLSKPPNTGICAILRLHHFRATAPQEGPWGRNGWWAILRNNTSSHFHTKQNQVAQMSIHCDTDNIKRVMIKALAQAVFTISTISWREGEEQLRPGFSSCAELEIEPELSTEHFGQDRLMQSTQRSLSRS